MQLTRDVELLVSTANRHSFCGEFFLLVGVLGTMVKRILRAVDWRDRLSSAEQRVTVLSRMDMRDLWKASMSW